jgi:hypothetical protein
LSWIEERWVEEYRFGRRLAEIAGSQAVEIIHQLNVEKSLGKAGLTNNSGLSMGALE